LTNLAFLLVFLKCLLVTILIEIITDLAFFIRYLLSELTITKKGLFKRKYKTIAYSTN